MNVGFREDQARGDRGSGNREPVHRAAGLDSTAYALLLMSGFLGAGVMLVLVL